MRKTYRSFDRYFISAVFVVLFAIVFSITNISKIEAQENTITVTLQKNASYAKFQAALDKNKDGAYDRLIVKVPAGTYNLTKRLTVYSNTTIECDSSALIRRYYKDVGGLISNYRPETGCYAYNGAYNITITGGIWDGNISQFPVSGEEGTQLLVFIHAENIVIQDAVIRNSYYGHLIALEGVKNGKVKNCTLYGYEAYKKASGEDGLKEAIQLDVVHSVDTAATAGGYDDTVCDGIEISGNTIHDFARGIGSHLAVKGVYSKNIKITSNKLYNIEAEAVKAFNYYNLTVSGNTIKNSGQGIKVYTSEKSSQDNYPSALNGVQTETIADNDFKVTISNNTVSNLTDSTVGSGIRVVGSNYMSLNNTTVTGNKITGAKVDGITLFHANGTTIQSNTVTNVKNNAIELRKSTSCVVQSNIVKSSSSKSPKGVSGIALYTGSNHASIKQNTITNFKKYGVALYKSSNVTVYKNTIKNIKKNNGIMVSSKSISASIQSNTIKKVKQSAIRVTGSNEASIGYNTAATSGSTSISVSKSTSVMINNNTVSSSKGHGIALYTKSTSSEISKNTITKAKRHGIIVSNSDNVKIASNKIKKPSSNGISLSGSDKAAIDKNTIIRPKAQGISVNKSNNVSVTANTIKTPKKNGIVSQKANYISCISNKITKAAGHGISINGSKSAVLDQNTVISAKKYGIFVKSSRNSKLTNNVCTNNTKAALVVTNSSGTNVDTLKAPKLNQLKVNATQVSGKAASKAKVYVAANKSTYSGKAKSSGTFTVKNLPELKAKQKIQVYLEDSAGNQAVTTQKVKK